MTAASRGTLRLPSRIHFGYGARAQLPELLALHGTRVLAVADPFLAGTPLFQEVAEQIRGAGLDLSVYTDIQPELPVATLDAAGAYARAFEPDVILALGGGSALDAAKLVALLVTHGGPLPRFYGENAVPGPILPVVAVPTTAGTGSEVTPVAVVSDPDRELKVGISSPHLIASAAVVDPEFTLGAPPAVTAFAGIDALAHAVESYTATDLDHSWAHQLPVFTGRNRFSETLALQAVEKLGRWLAEAVSSPGNRIAREEVALGSLLAGMSFGPTGTHLAHAIQYPLGSLTKTPHGLGTGLMLPYVLDSCRADPAVEERIGTVGVALGSTASTTSGRADDAITAIVDLNLAIGVPESLQAIGVRHEQLPGIADRALSSARLVSISPIAADEQVLHGIIDRAYRGTLAR